MLSEIMETLGYFRSTTWISRYRCCLDLGCVGKIGFNVQQGVALGTILSTRELANCSFGSRTEISLDFGDF